ncbi:MULTISPECIES: TetR/AcrR family transcriptional regulator [unclassified Actinotalea]|uniref:TetR/AcrR family transcriptional regulator n=1 Tax=unclassified Actinotalea TaxID=2638618 RepID=UPI0015F631BD|nr:MULTISPECIES: TetR/AcrR family transcriptional regulator [unclassified Actinotalea]
MPRPRLHDDALRVRLLETASEVIAAGGQDAVTVRDVARRAGTSASAVYALFGSRDALLAAVADEAFRRFADHLARAARTDDPAADLLALGLAYRTSALAEPHFYRVMFERAPLGAAVDLPTFDVLRGAVARALPPGPADATEPALALWGHVHGLVSLELAGLLPGTPDERAARYRRLLRTVGPAILGPPPAAP